MLDNNLEEMKKELGEIKQEIKRLNETLATLKRGGEAKSRITNVQFFKASISFAIALAGYSFIAAALTMIIPHLSESEQVRYVILILMSGIIFFLIGMWGFLGSLGIMRREKDLIKYI